VSRFEEWLRSAGLDLQIRRFPEGTPTREDAARAVGCEVGQIVKSLVFTRGVSATRVPRGGDPEGGLPPQDRGGEPVVALVSGANRVDLDKLAAVAGGPIGRADAGTARSATGYAIGGVPPFGHASRLPVYLDRDLLDHEVVWAAAGRPDAVFPIQPARLRELSGGVVVELA
jgi:prolyl-tRNA editing enzyme YbaK/EbsC (Cys-tRNA(Pro) deacylase)